MPVAAPSSAIRSPRAALALASPLRQEIVDAIVSGGPSTVAQLASALERRPDALYFHLRSLERVGLLRRTGTTGSGRSAAAVYDVPVRPMRLDYGGPPPKRTARLGPALDSLLRLARRDVRRALTHPKTRAEGAIRELWVARVRGRIGKKELDRVNALLRQCFSIINSASGGSDAVPIALAFALTPIRGETQAARPSVSKSRAAAHRRRPS